MQRVCTRSPGQAARIPHATGCRKKKKKTKLFSLLLFLSSTQSLSRVQLFITPWTAACQASLLLTISQSLLKFMSIESVTPSNHLILCRHLLLLPSIFPSIRVFFNESVLCIKWPKHWSFSFSFSISPFSEYSGLLSFRIDLLNLLAVQGLLKSLLQYRSIYLCIYGCSAWGRKESDTTEQLNNLWLHVGLCCSAPAFSSCDKRGLFFIAEHGLLIAVAVVAACGLSCSTACGIFPDQGLNPCPLYWQADS